MKRILLVFAALLISIPLFAQSKIKDSTDIVIDESSFRPCQTDAFTGVGIDPIALDTTRRPCARIKMKIDKMSKDDIDDLQIKVITNNQVTKCKTNDYETGLIIEMTAKTESRFYLQHPIYGSSNEVNLNLEANKEYYVEAQLNYLYSVNIASDVSGVAVYIDDQYAGETRRSIGLISLLSRRLSSGEHKVCVKYSGVVKEQTISVDDDNTYFEFDFIEDLQKAKASQATTVQEQPAAPAVTTPAKEPAKEPEEPKTKSEYISKRRFEQSADLSYNIGEGMGVGVNYILGGRINNTLYIGVGVGAGWQKNPYSCEQFVFPLYGHLRTYFGKGRCQPFLSLSAGVKFADSGKQGGLYGDPSFGVNFRSKSGKNSAWYISAGYLIQSQAIFDFEESTLFNGCKINVGLTF